MKRMAAVLIALHVAAAQAETRTSTTSATTAQAAQTQVDNTDRSAAQYWGLTLEDYRRYQALMKGVRGAISDPRISPIEVLGIHARDDAEHRKYAELFARLMEQDTQRVVQFQREYYRAFRRLYPKLVVLDFGPGSRHPVGRHAALGAEPTLPVSSGTAGSVPPSMSRTPSVTAGDRVLVFIRDNCRECDDLVQRSTALARQGATVDLYVVGARSDDDAQRFARRIALDPALVSSRRITLNVDGGMFSRVLPQQRDLPALVRKRGASLVQLAASEL
jgi:integrating conjugative element protein (TIGR03759 family)